MTKHDATEQAYKNGYSKGYSVGRRYASQITAEWMPKNNAEREYFCSNCNMSIDEQKAQTYKYCPECGATIRRNK